MFQSAVRCYTFYCTANQVKDFLKIIVIVGNSIVQARTHTLLGEAMNLYSSARHIYV